MPNIHAGLVALDDDLPGGKPRRPSPHLGQPDRIVQVQVRPVGATVTPARLAQWLSDEERARAGRFLRETDRCGFIEVHALLRLELGDRLGVSPRAIRFVASRHGKPEIAHPYPRGVTFNLSHAEGMIALALSRHRRVGVDVERRERTAPIELAERFLPREVAHIATTPADRRADAFLRLWTRKEAVHKADGRGLALPLNTFDVLDDRCGPWAISDLVLPPGYVGAVAWETDSDSTPVEIHSI